MTLIHKPTSRRRKIILRTLVGLVTLGLLGGTGFVLFMKIKFADFQPPMSAANVIVTPTTTITFIDRIEAIGTAAANQSASLTATITETVSAINAQEGEFVDKGASIIDLTSAEEKATLTEAARSFERYNNLAKSNLSSVEKRDEEEAALAVARAQLDKRKITAPFAGIIGIRNVDVGDLVQPGTMITTIDEVDPIKLDFTLPEIYLSVLKKDMEIAATTAAYPDQTFSGKIYVVDTRVDPETRAVKVRAILPNPDHTIKPGLLMNVSIIRDQRQALAIPEEAIMSAGDTKTVFVVDKDKKVIKKIITTGLREPGLVEVTSGLVEGENVIVEGQMKTGEGASVNITQTLAMEDTKKDALRFSNIRKTESVEDLDKMTAPAAGSDASTAPAGTDPTAVTSTPEPAPKEAAPETNTTQSAPAEGVTP